MSLNEYLKNNQSRQLEQLFELLRIPSISTDSAYKTQVRAAAAYLNDDLQRIGFSSSILETAGHPLVFAEKLVSPELPTVLIYGHYDVQPADPLDLWESDPFEPVIKHDAIIARGATDDKGQVFAHVKAVEALIEANGDLPVNVKFLIEGEEEIGSPSLNAFIVAHKEKLAADIVVISDGAMIAPGVPSITYGLKGLAYVEVQAKAAGHDLHSGAYGGGVPNVINGLAKIIAGLHDENGRVTVPGFYDDVVDISDAEREAFKRVPFSDEAFKEETGVTATPGEAGYSVLERVWARPTLDVNGISGGWQGEGSKTVIAAKAMAKISCRLVPNQDPQDITKKLSAHIKALAPEGVDVDVIDLHGGMPAMTAIDSATIQTAASALKDVFNKDVVFARTGGTIPVVADFQQLLGADVVLVGFGLESDRMHSPNEKFDLINFYKGIEASAALLSAFAGLK